MGAYRIVAREKMQMKFMSLNVPENIVSISWTKSSTHSVIPNLIRDLRCTFPIAEIPDQVQDDALGVGLIEMLIEVTIWYAPKQ